MAEGGGFEPLQRRPEGETVESCTIIVTDANELYQAVIHSLSCSSGTEGKERSDAPVGPP
jgi:hypothetical protein